MENSPKLNLPFIMPSQAQKHVTHNEAIKMLDALIQLRIISKTISTPPANPTIGDTYIIGNNPTGEWAIHEGEISVYQDEAWTFFIAEEGFIGYILEEEAIVAYKNGEWQSSSISGQLSIDQLAINAAIDPNNTLVVSGDNSLFNHDGTGHHLKINKNSSTDSASIIFQSGYSGRAEIGTTGDDNLHFKVTSDGSNWHEALIIDAGTGRVQLPNSSMSSLCNWLGDGGRMMGSPEPKGISATAFVTPNYLTPYNGATFSQGHKFIYNNNNFGGSGGQMTSEMAALTQKTRPQTTSHYHLRYGVEFFTLQITAGSGTAAPINHAGQTYYYCLLNTYNSISSYFSLNYWIKVLSGSCLITNTPNNRLFLDNTETSTNQLITPTTSWKQVTKLFTLPPTSIRGYTTALFGIYAKPQSEILIALPALLPFHIDPSETYGVIPSLYAWS